MHIVNKYKKTNRICFVHNKWCAPESVNPFVSSWKRIVAKDCLWSGSMTVYQPVTVAKGAFCAKHWQTNLTAMSIEGHVFHPILWDSTWERTNQIAPLSKRVPSAHMRPPTIENLHVSCTDAASARSLFWIKKVRTDLFGQILSFILNILQSSALKWLSV